MKYLPILLVISLYAADDHKPFVRLTSMQPRKIKKTVLMSGEWHKELPEFGKHPQYTAIVPLEAAQTTKSDDKKPNEQAK